MLFIFILIFIVIVCTKKEGFYIEYDELSKEESQILTLTGNNIFKYNLVNLYTNKDYELNVVYEVYEKDEKIKEEIIVGMIYEQENNDEEIKNEDALLGINIEEDKMLNRQI